MAEGWWEALGDLWDAWTQGSGGARALSVGLIVLAVLWLVSVVVTFRYFTRQGTHPGAPALLVAWVPFVVSAPGIAAPENFFWWALLGLALGPLLAAGLWAYAQRSSGVCILGHDMASAWAFCPRCPPAVVFAPPTGAIGHVRVPRGDGAATIQPAQQGPVLPPAHIGSPALDVRVLGGGPVLVWLMPVDPANQSEVAVHGSGATIGRNPAAEVHVADPTVSWEHARIVDRDGCPALVDLGSSNGIYVNGERVRESLLITDDRVQLGDTVFRVVRP